MSSCSLPLVLLVLMCVQSFTVAHNPKAPSSCCFTFWKRKVPEQFITKYEETHSVCTKPGIIFIMKSGRRVCADPRVQWVKDHMDNIDLRLYADTKQTYTQRPEPCCFSFQGNKINVHDINFYKITHSNCPNAGIHFIMKNDHDVCADPNDHWVKELMDAIDHRIVKNLIQSQNQGERPGLCCYTFWESEIPCRLITGYKETHSGCQKPGIIFFIKNDRHVCADPGVQWVKENIKFCIMDNANGPAGLIGMFRRPYFPDPEERLTSHGEERPTSCCFTFQRIEINVQDIAVYRKTHSDCRNAGIHFIMKNGNRVCADPKDQWVKDHMDEIDQNLLERLTKHTERPERCCFSFQGNKINVHDIDYKITHSNCPNAGIHFIMNGHDVCADPKDHWVKEHMDAIHHRHVANLMKSQHQNQRERPGLCCYTFWEREREIPSRLITGYKETHSACQKPGIILFLKNDRHVCAHPGVQ